MGDFDHIDRKLTRVGFPFWVPQLPSMACCRIGGIALVSSIPTSKSPNFCDDANEYSSWPSCSHLDIARVRDLCIASDHHYRDSFLAISRFGPDSDSCDHMVRDGVRLRGRGAAILAEVRGNYLPDRIFACPSRFSILRPQYYFNLRFDFDAFTAICNQHSDIRTALGILQPKPVG